MPVETMEASAMMRRMRTNVALTLIVEKRARVWGTIITV
jgi:hypothetical protein